MQTILVQMADKRWTTQALHLACALARNNQAQLVLLRLMQVEHISYLGSNFGEVAPTHAEYNDLQEYHATAEDYGVDLTLTQMQCIEPFEAVVEAAEHLDANVVFARVLPSRIPYLHRLRLWWLEKRFAAEKRQLYTLDQPSSDGARAPSITVKPARGAASKRLPVRRF